jgi:hypothetical protein
VNPIDRRECAGDVLNSEFPLIGRELELARVKDALLQRHSLLIVGIPGSGKTRLLEEVCSGMATQVRPVTIQFPAQPHELLVRLKRALVNDGHKALAAILKRSRPAFDSETSVHLRGVLWQALTQEPRPLIFEDIQDGSAAMYRFLWPIFHTPGISMIATAVSPERLGFLHRLFWDPRERLELKPLREHDAQRLACRSAERFKLPQAVNRAELQERILDAAAGNPGKIIEMYRLAADSRYRHGEYVKMALIQIDLAARFTA